MKVQVRRALKTFSIFHQKAPVQDEQSGKQT